MVCSFLAVDMSKEDLQKAAEFAGYYDEQAVPLTLIDIAWTLRGIRIELERIREYGIGQER